MLEKSRNAVFSNDSGVSGESKSRLVKAAGAESCGQRRNQNLHAVVARSTFWSQNVQNTSASEHFLKFRCDKHILKSKCTKHVRFGALFEVQMWKIARRCGDKHMLKSKCTKHVRFGPLFEVPMSKNCTPLWREAHFQVKMIKNWRSRSTFWSSDF